MAPIPQTARLPQPGDLMQAFGGTVGAAWKSVTGLTLPIDALTDLQSTYLREASQLWNVTLGAAGSSTATTAVDAAPAVDVAPARPLADRRFTAAPWADTPHSTFVAQMYLLNARTLMGLADVVDADAKTRARVRFAVQQWIDAASPSNYLALNPEAQRKALETGGRSIAEGAHNLLKDMQQGHVSQTDTSAFEVGRNMATTEGAVVFENDLFQLIEYRPLTPAVFERPMLFVPPCINKYYILDLQPDNSLIRYTVAQGHRTFVISWRNPDASLADKTWDDYIEHGPIAALKVVQEVTGARTVDALGFCVGGTILATALAVLAARDEHPVQSLTLLTTLLDFSETGILDIFIDEASVRLREMSIGPDAPGGPGLLKGSELASTFSSLRPNDLVWNYVVGNYLKGESPPPFDLLYWNGDSTNLPGPMFCWYLRHMYLQNELKTPGALTVCGEAVDLRRIEAPAYVYGSREDHIVPWGAAYASVPLLQGDVRFVLGASGHIAGVINPATKNKRNYWALHAGAAGLPAAGAKRAGAASARAGRRASVPATMPSTPDAWMAQAQEHPGSWWPDWAAWLASHAGRQVAAPHAPGSRKYPAIEAAPGRYVKAKA